MENSDVQPTITIKYVDIDDNLSELMQVDNIKIENNKRIDYHTAPEIKRLESKGYVLVENSFDPEGRAPFGESAQTSYIITLKHGIEKVTLSNLKYGCKTTDLQIKKKQIIHYTGAGNRTPRDNISTIFFNKILFFDKITGEKINNESWVREKGTFPKIATPNVLGYVPDKAVVGGEDVTVNDEDIEYTVTYGVNSRPSSNVQIAEVKYLDLDDANREIATSGELIGMANSEISYHTHDTIKKLIDRGYKVINNDFDADEGIQFFDSSDEFTQIFIVGLKHKKVIVDKENPISGIDSAIYEKEVARTIVYDGAEDKNPINSLQVAKWERKVVVDLVTKKVIEDDFQTTAWQPNYPEYAEVKNPVIPFYHTEEWAVLKEKVSFNDIAHRVKYEKNGKIIPINEDGSVINEEKIINFETDEKDPTKVKKMMIAPEIEGYIPVKKEIKIINPTENVELVYKRAHKYVKVDKNHPLIEVSPENYQKNVTVTIHYEGAGNKTPEDVIQKTSWNRSITYDEVTRDIIENGKYTTNWRKDKEEFEKVLTPAIDGYHADKIGVGPFEVGMQDVTEVVTYKANGRIIPVDKEGNEIPRAYHPSFITDPLNASNVFSIQSVPRILNYASKESVVEIDNPSQDIKIVYYRFDRFKQLGEDETFKLIFKDESLNNTIGKGKAIVNFVDISNNFQQIASSKLLVGDYGQKITDLYSTKSQIIALEEEGYQLVENNFDEKGKEQVFENNELGIKIFTVSLKRKPDPVLLKAQEKEDINKKSASKKKSSNLFSWFKK